MQVQMQSGVPLWKQVFPTRALILLMAIGFIDLIVTAVLHSKGLIVELNPVMKPIIEQSEWLFAAVKGLTLLLAWAIMVRYFETHRDFIRRAAITGSCAYLTIWTIWFIAGSIHA